MIYRQDTAVRAGIIQDIRKTAGNTTCGHFAAVRQYLIQTAF